MNTYNIIFFIILIITFVHHIIGSIAFPFFTSNNIIDYNCNQDNNYNMQCNNYYNSVTGYINYAILTTNTKDVNSSTKVEIDKDPSNSYTSLLPLTIMSILTLLFAIILLITYIFYNNIYIKSLIYILLGLCLLFACIILVLVPTDIMNKIPSNCSNIALMLEYNYSYYKYYNSNYCNNTLNYAYLTNVITSILIICMCIYLYYYGFKHL